MGIQWKKSTSRPDLAVKYGQGLRPAPKLRWLLLVLLLSIPFIVLTYELITEYLLVRFSAVVTYDTVTVRAPDSGYIKKLHVEPGSHVTDNQIVIEFASPLLEEKLEYLSKEKQRILDLMDSLGSTHLNEMKGALEISKQDVESSKQVYERFKKYANKGNLVELQLEEARINYVTAQTNYVELSQKIDEIDVQRKTLVEVNYKRKINEIENEIAQIKAKMSYFLMHSPENGAVMSLSTHEDEYVSAGQNLMTIVTDKNLHVIAFVDPRYMEEVFQGKKVTIKFPNNNSIPGTVINIPSYADKTPLSQINPLATRENKLIVIIKPDKDIEKIYQVFGIPVSVRLD
jgi:multidrug resistance efflux pump